MRRWFLLVFLVLLTASLTLVHAQTYIAQVPVNLAASSGSKLTAVDPLVYAAPSQVIPPRPFLYTVDQNGLTITRFNDNMVVSQAPTGAPVVGTIPWPKEIYVIQADGSWKLVSAPAGGWETRGYDGVVPHGNNSC